MHEPLPIPPPVAAQFKDWTATFEYSYGPETATWRLHRGGQTRYLKVARLGWEPSLARELDRMRWAVHWLPVPKALAYGREEGVEWLLTQLPRSAEHNPLLVRVYDFFSHYKWTSACQVLTGFMTSRESEPTSPAGSSCTHCPCRCDRFFGCMYINHYIYHTHLTHTGLYLVTLVTILPIYQGAC